MIGEEDGEHFIRIVDFGRSYFINEKKVNLILLTEKGTRWYPPEYFQNPQKIDLDHVVKPNPNQDVYSLGYFLKNLLANHALRQELVKTYGSIQEFYKKAEKSIPSERPSLKSFCNTLNNEINSDVENKLIVRC